MTTLPLKNERQNGFPLEAFFYYFMIGIFLALIAAKDLLKLDVPSLVFTLLWLAIIVFSSVERAAAFTICSTICFASSLSVTIPIAAFIVMAFLHGVRKIYVGCAVSVVLMILCEMTHFLDYEFQNFRVFINTSMFIILVLIITSQYLLNAHNPVPVLKHYIGFFLFLATDILVFTIQRYGSIAAILNESFRIGQTDVLEQGYNVAMSINANGLGFLALLAAGIALVLLNQGHMKKGVAIPVIIYSSFIGALTISKTFVICYVFLIGIFYLWYLVSHSTRFFSALKIALVIGILFLIFTFTEVYENIQYRFESTDLTTGRTDILWNYLKFMDRHPEKWLFGIGMQRMNIKAGFETVPHNGFLEAYVGLGLVGLFSIVYLVFRLFFLYRGRYIFLYGRKPRFLNYIPLFVHMFFIQSFQFIKISYIFVPLSLVYLCILVPNASPREE